MWRQALLAILLAAAASGCASPATPAPALTPVTVQLAWTHQFQFAGIYAADQKGFYSAEGLRVTLLQGGASADLLTPVLNGAAQFGITNGDALILARADGQPVRAIATVYRRSPGVFMALASSGIAKPTDFIGKKIQVNPRGAPLLRIMTSRVGVRPDQYTVVDSTPDLQPLYSGQVDARGVFVTNEVISARAAGYKVNVIFPDDYGIHFYSDTFFATDETITTNPDLVRRFLRATLKGWTYAVENPAAVGTFVQKFKSDADSALESAKMTASLPLVNTGEDTIGWMKPEMWSGMEKTLREQGVLTKTVDIAQAYTLQFLREIYGK